MEPSVPRRIIDRYALYDEIASGGMATVHLGRLLGSVGFARTVAIKRLHVQFAKNPDFVSAFVDEARLAARIRHPNVVQTVDVVSTAGELFLVMDFVHGESLAMLMDIASKKKMRIPSKIVASIIGGALLGLHAAHEATNEHGEPLGIVHRDISPQNILVGTDGISRVLDFGIAKAAGRLSTTRTGQLKGKLTYMAPEQIMGSVSRQTDIFAASVVFWEALTGRPLFSGVEEAAVMMSVLQQPIEPPSVHDPSLGAELDAAVLRGLERDPTRRYGTAREMALAIETCFGLVSVAEVGDWVGSMAGDLLASRAAQVAAIERDSALVDRSELKTDAAPEAPRTARAIAEADTQFGIGPAGGTTEQSSVSAFTRTTANDAKVRRTIAWVGGGIGCALLLSGAVWLGIRWTHRGDDGAIKGSGPAADVAVTEPKSSAEPSASSPPQESVTASSASVAIAPAGALGKSHIPIGTTGTARDAGVSLTAKNNPHCSPNYTVDVRGHKHYKPECF